MEKSLLFHKNPEVEEVHHVGEGGKNLYLGLLRISGLALGYCPWPGPSNRGRPSKGFGSPIHNSVIDNIVNPISDLSPNNCF
jgi:hypothetical protein